MPTTRKKAEYRPAPHVRRPVSDHVTTFVVAVALALVALVYGVEGATVGLPLRMLSAQVSDFTRVGTPGTQDDGAAVEPEQWTGQEQATEPDAAMPPPADENVELSPPPWDLDDWADAAPDAPVEETVLPLPPPQPSGNAQGGVGTLQAQIDALRQELAITQSTVVKLQEIVGILAASEWKSAAALPSSPPQSTTEVVPAPATPPPPSLPPVKPAHKTAIQEPTATESPSDTAEDGVDTETVSAPVQAPSAEPPPTDEPPAPPAPVPAPESTVAAPPVAAPPLPTDSVGAPALPPGIQAPGALPPIPEVPKGPPPAPLPQKRGWSAWFWGLLGR